MNLDEAKETERYYRCTTPAYGSPGHAHCAACCYGTGYAVTCQEEVDDLERALGILRAAGMVPS